MKLKFLLLNVLLIVAGALQTIYGQNFAVSGTVTGKAGADPLNGASITVKGSKLGTTTDAKGHFSLSVPDKNAVLIVSYTGMKTTEVAVSGKSTLVIQLEESASNVLTDVVVVGYGTQKITKVSGAISTIKNSDIEKIR